VTIEDIIYYVFDRNGEKIIIVDSYGTPYGFGFNKHKSINDAIIDSKSWNDFNSLLSYRPNRESRNHHDLKSHYARTRLLNSILVRRLSPDGEPINLKKVIAATDFDIAGSYIFQSILEAANDFAERNGKHMITDDMIYRIPLKDLSDKQIVGEFENPFGFDWNNAYAGKARSVFDFIYGIALTNGINKKVRELEKEKNLKRKRCGLNPTRNDVRLSVGRTQYLGLKKLIEDEMDIKNSSNKNSLYFIFKGYQDKEGIEAALREQDFIALHGEFKRASTSSSRFLELLTKDSIGTHTTRYKLISKLERRKLIKIMDNHIFSTPFANIYHAYMSNILESDFNIDDWNRMLSATMDAWSNGESGKDFIEKEYSNFMGMFYSSFRQHLTRIQPNMRKIAEDLIYAYHKSPQLGCVKPKQEVIEKEGDGILLKGNELIGKEMIRQLFDPLTGKPRHTADEKIIRYIPKSPINLENPIRQVCSLDRGYQFRIYNTLKLPEIIGVVSGNYTVYRADADGEDFKRILSSGLMMDNYTEMDIDIDKLDENSEDEAHESLQLTDVVPSDMAGPAGRNLMKEYHEPWVYTLDLIKKKEKGLVNVGSFEMSGLNFDRVSRYKFCEVHNFESLLSAMLDKYDMPFRKTAKLAEELYLNTGD